MDKAKRTPAEMEAHIAQLEARLATQQPVSFVVYSDCGKKVPSKSDKAKEVACKVDLKSLKCEHGGKPKGNVGVVGLQRYPITFYGDQLRRALPVMKEALAFVDANAASFARKADEANAA